jgi:hypothetical protein
MSKFMKLEDLSVYESIDPASLTREQKRAALRAINLIKEKRDGRLKERTVADGRLQRLLYDKTFHSVVAKLLYGTDGSIHGRGVPVHKSVE